MTDPHKPHTWPLLTDEARRLRNLIQEHAWHGHSTAAFERDLAEIMSKIRNGEQRVVPF